MLKIGSLGRKTQHTTLTDVSQNSCTEMQEMLKKTPSGFPYQVVLRISAKNRSSTVPEGQIKWQDAAVINRCMFLSEQHKKTKKTRICGHNHP